MVSEDLVRVWPAAGVSVRAGDLELRWIDDELLAALARVAGRGIHDPATMPFVSPWSRGSDDEVARRVMEYQWGVRPKVGPERLVLELGVLESGRPVGIQAISGVSWSTLREVETGSWLGREFHGRGIGGRMRAMMLHLCFDGLDAEHVTSTAFADNAASNAVSLRVGYQSDGISQAVRDGVAATVHRYRMTRHRWAEVREANAARIGAPVQLGGIEGLRRQLTPQED